MKIVKKIILMSFSMFLALPLFFNILISNSLFAAEPIVAWSSTIQLPYLLASHTSVSYDKKVFVLGGSAQTGRSKFDIQSAISENNGNLSNWETTSSPLPSALIWHRTVTKDNYVYVLGGREENPGSSMSEVNTVFLGKINQQEIINSWTQLNPLPKKLSLGGSVIMGNRIYYAGGFTSGGATNQTIYMTTINSDGTIGSWSTAGMLPVALFGFGMVENGNNLIIIGGYKSSGYSYKVYKTTINSNGTITSWQETNAPADPSYRAAVIRVDNKIFSIGGQAGNKVYYTDIKEDGTLEPWTLSSNNLPQSIGTGASAAYANNYLYVAGGFNGAYLNTVYYAKINLSKDTVLDVPLLKQTAEPWQSEVYNTADKWNPKDSSINGWGCAMTSAAMVLRYYEINKLPDDTAIDPGTLNTWLKNQPDGYIGKGHLNWLAISRLSRLAKSINDITDFEALEFNRTNGENKDLLTEDINNLHPDILEQPGHFIVATGIEDDTYLINDPAYDRSTLNDGYSNTFLSMRRFIPSNTDLSYIMLAIDPSINIELKDNLGNTVGEEFIEEAITSYADPNDKNEPIKIIYLSKPSSGKYTITLTGSSENIYQLEYYLYDKDGNVKVLKEKGALSDKQEIFNLNFDNSNSDNSISEKIVTFESTINDIKELKSLKLINENLAGTMIDLVRLAQKFQKIYKTSAVKSLLEKIEKILEISKGKLIKEEAYQILMYDITYLKTHL